MRWLAIPVLVALSTPAGAHNLWLERSGESDRLLLLSGHRHSGHQGEEVIEYDPGIVLEARCLSDQGDAVAIEFADSYPVELSCDGAAAYVLTSTGYWSKTPYGTENVPKGEAKMVIQSWLSYESVKRIERFGEALARPLADGLEIVPLVDPLALEPGDKLRLEVTRGRQPVAGAIVTYDGKPRGETDPEGKINVRIKHGGFQIIQATMTEPLDSADADQVIHTTSLDFELAP
jgi:nickel transport protein